MHSFLIHRTGDQVGVAIRDIQGGETVEGVCMDTGARTALTLRGDVPLGHKIALEDVRDGAQIVEYGVRIGLACQAIAKGDWVHTHNLRSARWPQ